MGAIIVVDAFWGDAGKGKFSAYFSMKYNASVCVRAGVGPNAGHSIYIDGQVTKTRMVPLGFVNPNTSLMIGAGVAIDPAILHDEIKQTRTEGRIFVDYRCPIITLEHKNREQEDSVMRAIDSTKTGAGAARADYIMRRGIRAQEVDSLKEYTKDVAAACNYAAKNGFVVVEGSQATFLSVYLSDRYPYTTSDNCTTAAFIDDVGLNWQLVDKVVLLVKCLPTAVGNGPLPNEMTREEITQRGLEEFGVNTGRRRRRVTHIDRDMLHYAALLNGPTEIALTYCDQYDPSMEGCKDKSHISEKMRELIQFVEEVAEAPVRYLETGKDFSNIIDLG